MSQLNYLEKLLDGVEVEWTTLGNEHAVEIANSGRKPVKAALRVAGETPYYGANNIQDYVDGYTHDGEFVLIAEDGSASLENYSIQYATGRFWANNHVHVVRGKEVLNTRYLYHYLCIVNFVPFLSGGGRAKLTKGKLVDIPLPIPCPDNPEKSLAIQAEIVRILDAFTAMTAELTAELNMRKKQYNYYRDQLLSFEDGDVEWVKLSTVANIKNGKDWKKLGAGNIPVYGSGGIMRYVDTFAYDKPTVLIPRKGSITNIFYVDEPFWNVDTIYYTELDLNKIIPKFFFYFMTTIDMMQLDTGSGRPSLTQAILNEIKIPLPALEEQARIISLLDKFDTLTSSITEGLPREIELRQKQYEYYRDLLLSFPKSHSDEAA
ncbi:restriction endonuclease subunit S [Thalassotalea sp. 1_MG-2023]|uniref:restriction endonuclease subunit S n=1 Tax=Thalassotalea sp. 1_MG-2023 TaxID=3062680 RepID=UPI0026E4137A|nr:restriction endonuclease subunit S [Thalassotalea sp. 1_MG-2023]MDO6427666.1 restriction endonuclease subunit S [Thalassotalea sp. 1_MG-2023]